MITKKDYINIYNKEYNTIILKDEYKIDENYIYYRNCKYPINKIIPILNFSEDFKEYIYKLEKGNEIYYQQYGLEEKAKIIRVNYHRIKLSKNKNNIISSFTIEDVNSKIKKNIKKEDIVYPKYDILYSDVLNVKRHFTKYLFFSDYVIEKADKIYEKIKYDYKTIS